MYPQMPKWQADPKIKGSENDGNCDLTSYAYVTIAVVRKKVAVLDDPSHARA